MRKSGPTRSRWPLLQHKSAAALVCLVGMLLMAAPASLANGKSVKVFLGYAPGISNWGAFEASGVARISLSAGQVHLVVNQLPNDPGIQYQAWVVPASEAATMIPVGSFKVDTAGHAEVDLGRPDLHGRDYRFFVITAEPVPDEDEAPDPRRALAGVFPNSKASSVSAHTQAFADLLAQSESPGVDGAETHPTGESPGPDHTDPQTQEPSSPSTLPVTGAARPSCSAGEVMVLAGGLLAVTVGSAISRLHQIRRTGGER